LTTTIKDTDILVVDAEVTNVFIDLNTGKVVPIDNEIISLWSDLGKYFNKNKSLFSKSA
jgi:acyl-CoA thioesterase FadM